MAAFADIGHSNRYENNVISGNNRPGTDGSVNEHLFATPTVEEFLEIY
jgi:hypothetical protein